MQIKKYLRIIGLILFIYILYKINLKELFFTLKRINFYYFLLALIFWFFSVLLKVFKWKILVESQNIKVSLTTLFKISLKGIYLGTITPGKLGEFWKAKYLVDQAEISNGEAFYTTLMDRIIDLITIISIGLISILLLFLFYRIKIGWMVISSILIFSILTTYFLIKKENTKELLKFLIKIFLPSSQNEKINSFLDEFFEGLKKLNHLLFLKLLAYGLGYYSVAVLVNYFIILSLGMSIPFWYLFLILALIWLILTLPTTILGLGTREASYIFFFSIFGVAPYQTVAFSLLILFCDILVAIPGMVLFFKNNIK